jgi:hypothetical protein
MAQSETITFLGNKIKVSELTVGQLDTILAETTAISVIDRIYNREMITESMLLAATGIDQTDLRSVAPSELRPLVEAFKTVNADFLSGMASIVGG